MKEIETKKGTINMYRWKKKGEEAEKQNEEEPASILQRNSLSIRIFYKVHIVS